MSPKPQRRVSKADAIRRAREVRMELLRLVSVLEDPGPPSDAAQRWATSIFEKSRSLESVIVKLRAKTGS